MSTTGLPSEYRYDSLEEGQEPRERSTADAGEVGHGSWVVPVSESEPVVIGCASEIDDETANDEADAGKNERPYYR